MKTSDYVAKFLASRGVSAVYELSGGMITHLLDSLHQDGRIRIVSVHHEQAAAFAADAAGRLSGIPGVAMATSGPGATNLLTGIGSCYFDSSPAVFITGQVNRDELRANRPIRQLGFQETDIVSMAQPITKAAFRVMDATQVPEILAQAFDLAVSGRPGPVLVDLPMDVQRADIPDEILPPAARQSVTIPMAALEKMAASIREARRPLILAGGGVRAAGMIAEFRAFVRRTHIPVVNSLNAVDILPYADPHRVGMIGSYGNRWANMAIGDSDLLVVVGSRLDIRQTGADTTAWKGNRIVFHVDCEEGEINNRVSGCEKILADLADFFPQFAAVPGDFETRTNWLAEIEGVRAEWPDTEEIVATSGINPNTLIHAVTRATPFAGSTVVDVGQHQMWAAQSAEIGEDQRFLTSGGMGSMGFALPAAIGAAVTTGRPVLVIAGDGGFQCNIQELQTVARNRLPIKIVIVNNGCHGMVRQFQESYFDGRYQSTVWGYDAPDFEAVARAYGIPARTVTDADGVDEAAAWLGSDEGPALLQVMVDQGTNVYPKIAFGRPMTEMEPFAKPIAMESTKPPRFSVK